MSMCASCGRSMSDSGPLCIDETHELVRRLRAVPELLADLELTLTRQDRLGGQGAGRSTERPVPWKEQVPDAIWALGNTLTVWTRELAQKRGLLLDTSPLWRHPRRDWSDPIGPLRPVAPDPLASLRFAAAWLVEHRWSLRTLVDAVAAHDEITDAVAHARRVIDRPADLRFVGPCGAALAPADSEENAEDDERSTTCERDLYVTPGAEIAVCPDCGTEWPVAERREWLLSIVHDEHVTYAEASRALSWLVGQALPASTIRTWVSRHQLGVARYLHRRPGVRPIYVTERQSPSDQPLVRVGDVITLVTGGAGPTRADTPDATTQS